ncbi:uncharacterized protein LOC119718757 [Patiria miniata]|uniref:Reverse transcriptase domain-containing protein n=1 Tax=Patiria miniata TaxID=46514 RepID=A0A913YX28_PATMI|nr:uncharacterized protein LOC119718757 [Patiria miniata]
MGIDLSQALDTIKRKHILDVLLQAGCNEDELRLARSLLAGTKLRVCVQNKLSDSFQTSIGSPQGDSLSPVLFTCYLAAALSSIRESSNRPNPPISSLGLPLEMEYAHDVDSPDEEKKPLDHLQPVAAEKLKVDNLFMNETKTEFTHVYLAEATETDSHGKAVRGNESWHKNKTLGSLLCSTSDITARCIQGNVTFHTLQKLWSQRTKIPLKTRLRLYNTYCVSIMLYNCNSWAAPKVMLDKLDACHRRHRSLLAKEPYQQPGTMRTVQ